MVFIDFNDNKTFKLTNEHELQCAVVDYLRTTDLVFASNCNGFLDTSQKRLTAYSEGMSSGHPDLIIYTPNNLYNMFCIEFKTPCGQGEISPKQSKWLSKLETECKAFCICSNDYTLILECIIKYIHNIIN
jgi:hypothetical protein